MGTSHRDMHTPLGSEERTYGADGNRSMKRHKMESEDNVRGNAPLSTPRRKSSTYGHHNGRHSSSTTRRRYHHHHHRRKRERDHMPDEFKKVKPPTFDGVMKKYEDAKAWLLGMKKFFRIHNYYENMKAKVATYSLKGKAYIWWEDLKKVNGITKEGLNWNEFKRLFREICIRQLLWQQGKRILWA